MVARHSSGLLTAVRQLALFTVLVVGVLLARGGPALAACPDDDSACESVAPALTTPAGGDTDLPYVDEITAPPTGTALTFADPD
jgi:hypothetical protein